MLWSTLLFAKQPENVSNPIDQERLSEWLLRQQLDQSSYLLGIIWSVPSARLSQAQLKRKLIDRLNYAEKVSTNTENNLDNLIRSLPVTGRVSISNADPRWLQAHPKEDPFLYSDHTILIPRRPDSIIVLTNEGKKCVLPHHAGLEARIYVKACEPTNFDRVDYVWVIQPNGSIRSFGVANWNIEVQDELSPGAIVWAPLRDKGFSPEFSSMLVQFLSTQNYNDLLKNDTRITDSPKVLITKPNRLGRDLEMTANDWGSIGLLQTPTARMSKAGEARFHFSNVYPYDRYNTFMQPFDFLEIGFRYTSIVNALYGPEELSGNQTYKDKSVDFKSRLVNETATIPQIAVGMIDLTGTGLFSSEYLVASKRFGNFDGSIGIGWGYLGSSGNITNPTAIVFGEGYKRRVNDVGQGGQLPTGSYFRGNTALFGGLQYQTPLNKWILKLEYDGNNYQQEPFSNKLPQRSPVNASVLYRYSNAVDFSLGFERGNTYMLGITLHAPLNKINVPKVSDPPTLSVLKTRPKTNPIWDGVAADISGFSGWSVNHIGDVGNTLHVVLDNVYGTHFNDRMERVIGVLHRNAPDTIEEFSLVFIEKGMPMTQRVVHREAWVKNSLEFQGIDDYFQATQVIDEREPNALPTTNQLFSENSYKSYASRFGYSIGPSFQQSLGGPDSFVLFRASVSSSFGYKLLDSTSITGTLNLGLIDNYGKFKYTAPSDLPRVRTFTREYMTTTQLYLPNLQITHSGKLVNDQYYSFYGGYLESMFAGVGGEWLYRPWHGPLAFGIDINRVQQRSFEQDFSFNNAGSQTNYRVTTGHASTYWDTGWESVLVKFSVGRYLAGDTGATINLGRAFNNGVEIGAWVTKTNVSAAQFGEGSFDKGIYLKIPFDVMTTSRSSGAANLVYQPLLRDGGAQLNRGITLYNSTNLRDKRSMGFFPSDSLRAR